ncbi:hypothetical protein D3C77_609740 [compost metagenome]
MLEDLHGSLEAVLVQDRHYLLEGFFPGRQAGSCFDLARRTGVLQMRHDVSADPAAGGRVGERCAVVEAQLHYPGQTLEQEREVKLHFAHGLIGV